MKIIESYTCTVVIWKLSNLRESQGEKVPSAAKYQLSALSRVGHTWLLHPYTCKLFFFLPVTFDIKEEYHLTILFSHYARSQHAWWHVQGKISLSIPHHVTRFPCQVGRNALSCFRIAKVLSSIDLFQLWFSSSHLNPLLDKVCCLTLLKPVHNLSQVRHHRLSKETSI